MTFRLQSVPGIVQQLEGSCWSTFSKVEVAITYSISASHSVLCDVQSLCDSCATQFPATRNRLQPRQVFIGIPVSRQMPQLGAVIIDLDGLTLPPARRELGGCRTEGVHRLHPLGPRALR